MAVKIDSEQRFWTDEDGYRHHYDRNYLAKAECNAVIDILSNSSLSEVMSWDLVEVDQIRYFLQKEYSSTPEFYLSILNAAFVSALSASDQRSSL